MDSITSILHSEIIKFQNATKVKPKYLIIHPLTIKKIVLEHGFDYFIKNTLDHIFEIKIIRSKDIDENKFLFSLEN